MYSYCLCGKLQADATSCYIPQQSDGVLDSEPVR